MPGPRVVTRVTLELLSTSAFIENVTVASEGSAAHRHLEEIQREKRSVLLSSAVPSLYSLGCCRHAQGLPSHDAIPPHAGLRGMRVQRCHSRPARPAHRALLETCALHTTPRVSALRGIALWKPQPAQPPRSQRAERGLAERMRSPARRVPLLAHLSSTCCGPIHLPLAVCCKPRLAEASPRPHLSYLAASHSACAAACSALHVRPAAATHLRIPVALLASLCAPAAEVILPICGHLWAPSLRLPCSRSCSARSLCLCAAGRWQPLSATPTLWEWVRAGMS